jgi:hypothetical protein
MQAMNHALEPVLNVLRMRLESPAVMTPDHSQAYTTSVDLLIQRVVGLSPRAPMTDDLIGAGRRSHPAHSSFVFDIVVQPFATSRLAAKRLFRIC